MIWACEAVVVQDWNPREAVTHELKELIHWKKCNMVSTKILSSTTVFNINRVFFFFWAPNQHIMFSEDNVKPGVMAGGLIYSNEVKYL